VDILKFSKSVFSSRFASAKSRYAYKTFSLEESTLSAGMLHPTNSDAALNAMAVINKVVFFMFSISLFVMVLVL